MTRPASGESRVARAGRQGAVVLYVLAFEPIATETYGTGAHQTLKPFA
jgi:hypothetical protein